MIDTERTQEDIDDLIALATIQKDDLLPTTQTIYFCNDLSTQKQYKFLQLTSNIEQHLKAGDVLHINGEPNDDAVLCTHDATYEIINTETSNSLLVMHNLKFKDDLLEIKENGISTTIIEGVFHDCLEVIQTKPSLDKLHSILEKATYKGPELEYNIDQNYLYTFDELWKKAQTSKTELKVALKEIQAIVVDEKYRLLDFEYHFRVLSYLLKIIEENSWQLDEVDYEITIESLTDVVPLDVLNAVFDLYTEETKVRDGTQLYRYKEYDVCQFFAQVLLYNAGKFNLREFLQAWQESVPEGMITDQEMLYGIAIVDRNARPNVIWSFSEKKLTQEITERFEALFVAKKMWSVNEISPYIQNLTTNKLGVSALLTKHARPCKIDGITFYCSKHGK